MKRQKTIWLKTEEAQEWRDRDANDGEGAKVTMCDIRQIVTVQPQGCHNRPLF
jgi:hypothetical protein